MALVAVDPDNPHKLHSSYRKSYNEKSILSITCLTFLTGCATIFSDKIQPIQMDVVDEQENLLANANCVVVDPYGAVYYLDANPGSVVVTKGKGKLRVECDQPGYQNYVGSISGTSLNPVALLDIIFWPSIIVDVATGSILQYPGSYSVTMTKT